MLTSDVVSYWLAMRRTRRARGRGASRSKSEESSSEGMCAFGNTERTA